MRSEVASFPAFGVDTVARVTRAKAEWLRAHGYSFVVRYLGSITPSELAIVHRAGLACMFVTYSRGVGWIPSEAVGRTDGDAAVAHAQALDVPRGATLWLDLEGCAGPPRATSDWAETAAIVLRNAGYECGLYVGAMPGGLDADGLWKLRGVTRYWRSCSRVPEPSVRGFCMSQLRPHNQHVGPVWCDVNVVENDYRGDRPHWVIA